MKKALVILLPTLFFFSSCTTDFEIAGEWKDIPIVYGFINPQDTAHYVRIEKAFLDPDGDAQKIAQLPDSLYYDNIAVSFEIENTSQSYTLTRVDGNVDGYPREEGVFADSPNYLYKIKNAELGLQGGEELRLVINRGDNLPEVNALTTVLTPIAPVANSPSDQMTINYLSPLSVSWRADQSDKVFDLRMVMHYKETDPNNSTQFLDKEATWVLDRAIRREDDRERISYNVIGEDFYRFFGNEIEENNNVIRIFISIDIIISAAGQELIDLIDLSQANIGITSSQQVPTYSNISEGLGIFTSRSTVVRTGLTLSSPTLDSLRNGVYTEKLNFQ